MEKKDVFISYSRKDTAVAEKICAAFDRAGITYFIDRQGIGGGMEFPIVLANAIMECKLFLYLASENSYQSKFTNSEITFAFNEKPKNSLLPYIIDKSNLPIEMKFIFSGINWRNTVEHPIDTVLIEDVMRLLSKEKTEGMSGDNIIQSKGNENVPSVKEDSEAAEQGPALARDALEKLTKTFTSPTSSQGSSVGRNDPCPCGSGKKYKNCHGRQ